MIFCLFQYLFFLQIFFRKVCFIHEQINFKSAIQKDKKYIVGLGSPIIDITAKIDEKTINELEIQYGKTVVVNEKNKKFFQILESSPDVNYIPGGSVTNSIRVTSVF